MRIVSLALITVLLAGLAVASNPSLVDKDAPGLKFGVFADAAPPATSLKDLRGDVVLLVYLRTSCPGCRAVFTPIEQARVKLARTDVHIITTTNDSRNLIRRYLVHESEGRRMNYPIAIRSNGEWGVRALPMAYVIGRDGKVTWSGYRNAGFLKEMEKAVAVLDPALPDGWKGAARALADLGKGKYAKALAAARKAGQSGKTAAAGKYVEARITAHLERALAAADRHLARGDVWSACTALVAAEKAFKGTDLVARLAKKRAEIEARKDHAKMSARWRTLANIWAAARKGKAGLKAGIGKLKVLVGREEEPALLKATREMLDVFGKPWTQSDAATMGGLLKDPAADCGE